MKHYLIIAIPLWIWCLKIRTFCIEHLSDDRCKKTFYLIMALQALLHLKLCKLSTNKKAWQITGIIRSWYSLHNNIAYEQSMKQILCAFTVFVSVKHKRVWGRLGQEGTVKEKEKIIIFQPNKWVLNCCLTIFLFVFVGLQ